MMDFANTVTNDDRQILAKTKMHIHNNDEWASWGGVGSAGNTKHMNVNSIMVGKKVSCGSDRFHCERASEREKVREYVRFANTYTNAYTAHTHIYINREVFAHNWYTESARTHAVQGEFVLPVNWWRLGEPMHMWDAILMAQF